MISAILVRISLCLMLASGCGTKKNDAPPVAADWLPEGVTDFNRDGTMDVLVRADSIPRVGVVDGKSSKPLWVHQAPAIEIIAFDSERAYFTGPGGALVALAGATGTQRWATTLPARVERLRVCGEQSGGYLVADSGKATTIVNPANGAIIATVPSSAIIVSSTQKVVTVLPEDVAVGYDPATGKETWRTSVPHPPCSSGSAVRHFEIVADQLVVASRCSLPPYWRTTYSLASGEVTDQKEVAPPGTMLGFDEERFGRYLFDGPSFATGGVLSKFDGSLAQVWKVDRKKSQWPPQDYLVASVEAVVVRGENPPRGLVVLGDAAGDDQRTLISFDDSSGVQSAARSLNKGDRLIGASSTFALVLRHDSGGATLTAYDLATLEPQWQQVLDSVDTRVHLGKDAVYVATTPRTMVEQRVVVLQRFDLQGKLQWQRPLEEVELTFAPSTTPIKDLQRGSEMVSQGSTAVLGRRNGCWFLDLGTGATAEVSW